MEIGPMSRENGMHRFWGIILLATVVCGCRRDPVVDDLTQVKPKVGAAEQALVDKRVELALSKWKNQRIDPEPVLIFALLRLIGPGQIDLAVYVYDEEKDIIGLGIKEDRVDSNGEKTSRLEDYPALIYRQQDSVVALRGIPVQIRDAGQGQDTQRWQGYANGVGIDVNRLRDNSTAWRKSLPAVWVSLSEPNKVDISIYVYDKDGHKSDPVRLVNCVPTDEQACATNLKTLYAGPRLDGRRVFGQEDGMWPDPNQWCDVIVDQIRLRTGAMTPDGHVLSRNVNRAERTIFKIFTCPGMRQRTGESSILNKPNSPAAEGESRESHYAMNADCGPNSPADCVILFETKTGWNRHGGPELFTFDNHDPKGGWVLLKDGSVRFIRTEAELQPLRWK